MRAKTNKKTKKNMSQLHQDQEDESMVGISPIITGRISTPTLFTDREMKAVY
jgi:hypothetical protein